MAMGNLPAILAQEDSGVKSNPPGRSPVTPLLLYAFLTFTGAQASMWPDVASIQPILCGMRLLK
jgi:hypothetical protein